jgi:signal peptidase I
MENTIMPGEKFFVTRTGDFKRNDIVVFDYYGNDYRLGPDESGQFKQHWEKRIYRVIAVSGDTLQLKNDEVLINGKPIRLPDKGKLLYNVYSTEAIDELEPAEGDFSSSVTKSGNIFIYHTPLTKNEVHDFENRKPAINRVQHFIDSNTTVQDSVFARPSATVKWDSYNYGPLYIPRTGETIEVTEANYKLYHNIPGIKMGYNKIMEELYFVLGDNRHFSEDSRFIGFISQSKMYGVVK